VVQSEFNQFVKVIKGIAEAYYDWMVLNYKFGKLGLIHHESEQSRSRFAIEPSFWSPRQQSPEPYLFLHSEKRFPSFSKEDKPQYDTIIACPLLKYGMPLLSKL
jgi:hypothetical protein